MLIEINVQSFIINNSMYNKHVWSLGGTQRKSKELDLNNKKNKTYQVY